MTKYAQINKFVVTIDALAFGSWTKCDGLKASYDIKEYTEGGQNNFVHNLMGRLKFEKINLQRAVCEETNAVAGWFAMYQVMVRRSAGSIAVCASNGDEIFRWSMTGIVPVSWSAAGLDAAGNGVLIETLTLAHDGFLDMGTMAAASVTFAV
jgi:phage tail-like protein